MHVDSCGCCDLDLIDDEAEQGANRQSLDNERHQAEEIGYDFRLRMMIASRIDDSKNQGKEKETWILDGSFV